MRTTKITMKEYSYRISLVQPNYLYSAIEYGEAIAEVKEISGAALRYYKQKRKEIQRTERKVLRELERIERYAQ